MIVPCNTTVPVVFKIGGMEFILTPPTYNLGPLDSTGTLCLGGFSINNFGKQSFLDCFAHYSHIEQDSGYWVPS
jgi:hypothetical protein